MADNNDGLKFSLRAEVDDFLKDFQAAKQGVIDVASVVGNAVKEFLSLSKAADTLSNSEAQVAATTAEASQSIQEQSEYVKLTGVEVARMGKYYTQLSYELRSFVGDAKRNADSWHLMEAGTLDGATALQKETIAIANNIRALKDEEAATKRTAEGQNEFANSLNESNYSGLAGVRTLHDLARAFTSGGVGTAGFTRSLVGAADQIGYLTQSTGSFMGALKTVGASIMGPAGIILGFSLLAEVVGEFISSSKEAEKESDKLAEKQKTIAELMDEAANSTVAEGVRLQTLAGIVTDTSQSYDKRSRALNALKETNKDYFGDLTLEASKLGTVKKAVDAYIDSLIRQAQIKAIEPELEKAAAAFSKVQEKLQTDPNAYKFYQDSLLNAVSPSADTINKARIRFDTLGKQILGGQQKLASDIALPQSNSLTQRQVTDQVIADAKKKLDDIKAQFAQLITGDVTDPFKFTKDGKSTKDIKDASDILKDLAKNIQAVKDEFSVTGGDGDKFIEKLVEQYKNAAGELSKLGVSSDSDLFKSIQESVNKLQQQLGASPNLNAKVVIPIEASVQLDNPQANFSVWFNNIVGKIGPELNNFTKQVNGIIKNSITDGITSVAEATGEALVSGNWNGVLSSFANTISSFLAQLGKLLIAEGVAVEAFQKSLDSGQGIPAIIAGAALVVASGAFKAFASKGPEKFATGGTVYGPTLALIGDNPSGVEHIIPQEVLDKMGGRSGFNPGDIIAQIKGNDLVLVMGRAQKQQRNNG